jgi:hypothetical protein
MLVQSFPTSKILPTLIPIFLILFANLIALSGLEVCVIVFLVLPVVLSSFYIYCAKKNSR